MQLFFIINTIINTQAVIDYFRAAGREQIPAAQELHRRGCKW
jgi:hypothetical protein